MVSRARVVVVAVLGALAAPVLGAEDPEGKLDLGLRLVLREQSGRLGGGGFASSGGGVGLLRRLRGVGVGGQGTLPLGESLLNVLIRYDGPRGALRGAGFRVGSCVGTICTGTVRASRLGELAGLAGVKSVQSAQRLVASGVGVGSAAGERGVEGLSGAAEGAGGPSAPFEPREAGRELVRRRTAEATGSGVLVAFVDTGVDVRHHDFRKGDGTTRIKYLLDLSDPGDVDSDGDLDGAGPFGGTLYTESQINAALVSGTALGERDTTGHGTHGLSIAAGDETPVGLAPGADLVVVKATREDGTLGFVSTDVVNALSFVEEKAGELGQPYVVNLSLGTVVGSHDGRSLEEQAVDELVGPGRVGRVAVIAAGNSSENRLSRYRHFQDRALVGLVRSHSLRIPPYTASPGQGDDRVLLDVWYRGGDKLAIHLRSPGGRVVRAGYGEYVDEETEEGNVFIANLGGASLENGDVEALVLVDDWSGVSPAVGEWTVEVEGEEISDSGEYDGWLSDDSVVGGEAAYLSGNADNRKLVGRPGTSFNGVTVGSYAWHEEGSRYRTSWVDVHGIGRTDATAVLGDISDFSSPGGTRDGRMKPEVVAPGERVLGAVSGEAWPGVSATSIYRYHGFGEVDALVTSGVEDRGYGVLQGTSFSAPVVTGLAARILSLNPGLDAVQVRNVLVNGAVGDGYTGGVPNEVWGWGKVSLTVGGGPGPLPSDLRVETWELPTGYVEEPYQVVLMASGGRLPYAWSLSGGELPQGLTLDGHGLVSGQPTVAGEYAFEVRVTDGSAPTQAATRTLRVSVSAEPTLEVETRVLPGANLGAGYDEALEARGGTPPYAWSLAGGALPPGLDLQAGRIQGTPSQLGRFDFTVRLQDAAGAVAFGSVRVRVTRAGADLWNALGIADTEVNQIAVDPNDTQHLFAATDARPHDPSQIGVFESRDGGESWRCISDNFAGFFRSNSTSRVTWLAVSPRDSVAWGITDDRFGNQRVVRYDPASSTWTMTFDACEDPAVLEFDDSETHYLFCAPTTSFRRSTDGGTTWQTIGHLCGGTCHGCGVGSLTVSRSSPSFLYATRADLDWDYTCKSADGGVTWSEIDRLDSADGGSNYHEVAVSQSDPLDVVRTLREGSNQYAERSVDGGQTWTRTLVTSIGSPCCLRRSPSDPSALLYGSSSGLHKSLDDGLSWTPVTVKGFATLDVTAVAFDPHDASRFYVGSTKGVFSTADGGATWSQKNRGLIRRGLTGMAMSFLAPDEVLLTTYAGEPYLSRTMGDKWTRGGVTFTSGGLPNSIFRPVISAADADLYFLVTGPGLIGYDDGGLFRSTNRGLTWTNVYPYDVGTPEIVAPDPFDANVIIFENLRSTDQGETWTTLPDPPGVGPSRVVFARDVRNRLYGSWNHPFNQPGELGIRQSSDGGLSWQPSGLETIAVNLVEPAPSDSGYVYATSGSSSAPGSTVYYLDPANPATEPPLAPFRRASVGPPGPVHAIAVDWTNPRRAYAAADGGLFRTTDGGDTWTRVSGALDPFDVQAIAIHPTAPGTLLAWAAYSAWPGGGGVFRSSDGGVTWKALDAYGNVGEVVNMTVKHPSQALLFAGTEGYGVQVSSDGGASFQSRVSGLANLNVNALAFEPGSATVIYAATDRGIYKSTDTGNSWLPTALSLGEVTDLVTDNEGVARRIWGTVRGEGVAFSADGGATFNLYSSGLASLELTSLHLEVVGTARRIWGTTRGGDGVVFSDDLGETWQSAAGAGLTDRNVNDFTTESGAARRIWGTARRIWGTTDSGVFFSDNDGQSWSELSLGLPSGVPVSSVSIDPKTNEVLVSLFSEREGGVYRGGNLNGVWRSFSEGLDSLKVRRVTNDGGRTIDPTTTATTFYAATAGDGAYANEIRNTAAPAPLITTVGLPGAQLRVAYSAAVGASGGVSPLAWSVPEGYLPTGLVLDAGTGEISGVPGQEGTFAFSVQVADSLQRLDRKALTIVVSRPLPSATALDVTVVEGDTGTREAVFTVTLSRAAEETVTVSYATEDGTATGGLDYQPRSGVLSIAPGVLSQAVSVPVIGDVLREGRETFSLVLSEPTNALLSRERILGTIRDDDARPSDWNADGRSDLLWSHGVSGTLQGWMLEGTAATSFAYLTPARPSERQWQIRALVDFDGDSWTDVLWQHVVSGELFVWFLEGTTRRSGAYLEPRGLVERSWVVRGGGDFDGDGHADLLWHHQGTGDLQVWLMTGTVRKQSVALTPGRVGDVRWQVRGVWDFDGDGKVDVLWHHQRSGELELWRMDGTVRIEALPLSPGSMVDVGWKVGTVLDFDGDGHPDILWHHQRSGELVVWRMEGTVRVGEAAFTPPVQDPTWRLAPRWDVVLPTTVRRRRTR
jgi:hypothetical protein